MSSSTHASLATILGYFTKSDGSISEQWTKPCSHQYIEFAFCFVVFVIVGHGELTIRCWHSSYASPPNSRGMRGRALAQNKYNFRGKILLSEISTLQPIQRMQSFELREEKSLKVRQARNIRLSYSPSYSIEDRVDLNPKVVNLRCH